MTQTEQDQYLLNAAQCLANECEARACGDLDHATMLYRKAQAWRSAANSLTDKKTREDTVSFAAIYVH